MRARRTTIVAFFLLSFLVVIPEAHASSRALPKDVQRLLDQKFPGWRFATIVDHLKGRISPDSSPAWVQGDYDGDGKMDYAVQLVRPVPGESQQIVVVLLRRDKEYELHTLKSFGIQQASYLRTSPKGHETMDVENGTKIVNPTDAIELLSGREAGETFMYEHGRFRLIASGD